MARNLIEQPDPATAQYLNQHMSLEVEAAMSSAAVASMLPRGKAQSVRSECREATVKALQVVEAERSRCADAEIRTLEAACKSAADGEAAAKMAVAQAHNTVKRTETDLTAANAKLSNLRARLPAEGEVEDNIEDRLAKTESELSKSWDNLEDAIKAEIAGEVVEQWPRSTPYQFKKPLQKAAAEAVAMVGPGGQTAETIAERDFIPISANFVPVSNLVAQWQSYAQTRERLGKMADPSIWRVCRNVLVTDSDAQAQDILADPDGTFAYYYRYIRGVRQIEEFREHQGKPLPELNALLEVDVALEESVIAGSLASVQDRLVDLVDQLGPFGTLVMVGQDWDDAVMWPTSMRRMAEEVMPVLTQHADQLK